MPFRTLLPMIRESSSGATAATRDPRRPAGVHIQRSLDESAVRRAHQQPHSSTRGSEEERLSHGQQQEVSLSETAISGKTASEGRLDEAGGQEASGSEKEAVGGGATGGARGKVRMGELNKAKSSSTSQLSQAGTLFPESLCFC